MSLCSGDVVYASLAQMAVKGQANAKVEGLAIGMLDVFSSAFWSHPSFAHSVIRNCDEELAFNKDASNVHIFEPPKSFDVVYNMWATIDIPGLVNMASIYVRDGEKEGKVRATTRGTAEYEVLNKKDVGLVPKFSAKIFKSADTNEQDKTETGGYIIQGTNLASAEFLEELVNANAYAEITIVTADALLAPLVQDERCIVTNYGDPVAGQEYTLEGSDRKFNGRQLWRITDIDYTIGYTGLDTGDNNDAFTSTVFTGLDAGVANAKEFTFVQSGLTTYAASVGANIMGSPFVFSDSQPRYVDSVGQYIIKECEMTIGGARVGLLNSMYLYIHEELMGQPGRRMYEMCGKQGDLSDPALDTTGKLTCGTKKLLAQSMQARRLYVNLPFWWANGKLERALKTIALQLHKVQFKITARALKDCVAYASWGGSGVPAATTEYQSVTVTGGVVGCADVKNYQDNVALDTVIGIDAAVSIATYTRAGEEINQSRGQHSIGPVRPSGGDVQINKIGSGTSRGSDDTARAYLTVDFAGIFLNQQSRDLYLKLDEKTLFTEVLGTDTDGTTLGNAHAAAQTQTLAFSNGVTDVMVAAQSLGAGKRFGDVWGLMGTLPDSVSDLRDDALQNLSFNISSTPRTMAGLSADYYRTVTQYHAANTMSSMKGLYYWNVQLFSELNGTRCVNSFLNCSKIDDLRVRYKVNNEAYGPDGSKLLTDGVKMQFFSHSYNIMQFRGGMAGKTFA